MDGMIYIEKSPLEVDFYFANVKIISIIGGSLIFTPESPDIVNHWNPRKLEELAAYIAPFIVKTMPK